AELPVHFEITHQVLPTVAEAYITDGSAGKTSAACHDKVNVFALGADEFCGADFRAPGGVAGAATGNVRSQQRVDAQLPPQRFIEHFDFGVHEQDRPMWISEHMFYQTVAAPGFRIREAIKDAIAFGVFDQMTQVTLFLVAKRFSVTDEKLKVARVRFINMSIVNLIDDTVTEGEPETATRMVGCTDAFFRTRS